MNMHGTTIIGIKKDNKIALAGDGQVTLGNTVMKNNAKKVRKLGRKQQVIAGFAGSTADAMTLFERLETKLEKHSNILMRACVELAKDWRQDKYLRKLEAMMLVADSEVLLLLSGNGDVIQPDDPFMAIGSGGAYALAAAKALFSINNNLDAEQIAKQSIKIASEICIYTNNNITCESLEK